MWPDWAIYWTLGNLLKPLATINLPKSPTFLGNFSNEVKIFHFSNETFFGNFNTHLAIFFGSHWTKHKRRVIFHSSANDSMHEPMSLSEGGDMSGYIQYRAIYDFDSRNPDELPFKAGDIIMVNCFHDPIDYWNMFKSDFVVNLCLIVTTPESHWFMHQVWHF